jgi:ABC-2 type transport system ATP-binding protein
MENALLDIQNVSKFYTNKVALQHVSIQVPKGSIYGLLGPNGAGKTSLIRIINQITQADEGEVFFNGEKLGPLHIKDIGYLPEERGLYKKIKVARQLEYFARLRGLSADQASEKASYWLKRMGMYDVRNKKIEELSKGMQQKIQFIVSVINSPVLLILDEPFSGFDPVNAELLTEVILELKQNGTTIIFSTHRMESVEKLCDYMALIHLSKKILDGKVSDIRRQFISDKFEVVTEKPIELNQGFNCIESGRNEMGQYWYMLNLQDRSPNSYIEEIMRQTDIVSFNRFMPSINDIFIQLVTQ